ncbi:hypothetical protein B0A52_03448 [Exophiala mesophila]|uniref:Uncharacterized protein n=1 Tax=Exophiala mesophila TaxID=212818 RepID=A0A438N641_EXOME|nr:hypothetical protein B0A52_03448 [Exophiala mesophila]
MEVDRRTFASVKIGFHSVEIGPDRFKRDELYDAPPHALWRNNLTALSQRHNLYFVASLSSVLVYRPEFPFQTLGRTPQLVIPQALAKAGARGYIDPNNAHSINHLMVGDLGNQEILLLATDSGNIAAYYTRSIQEAILRKSFSLSTTASSDVLGLQPFFTHWVHESAWGLSIHTQARMIAVSANTPYHVPADNPCATIWVFAFALTERDSGDEGLDDESYPLESSSGSNWHDWDASRGVDYPSRDRNYKIVLAGFDGHDSNIPCVSFVNNLQDPYGRWLLSTDIDGATKIWHIWRAICHRSWDLTERGLHLGLRRRREGGWLVAALDPEMFGLAQTMEEFCGHSRAALCYGATGESYDLTNIVRLRTPGHSHAHPLLYEASDDSDDGQDWDGPSNMWSDDETGNSTESVTSQQSPILHSQLLFDSTAQGHRPTVASDTHITGLEHPPSSEGIQPSESGASDGDSDIDIDRSDPRNSESPFSVSVVVEIPEVPPTDQMMLETELQYDSSSDEDEDEGSSLDRQSISSLSSLAQRTYQETEELIQSGSPTHSKTLPSSVLPPEIPNFPILHCSASNLRLFNGPDADSAHVYCASILTQALPPVLEVHHFSHFDRLNMIQIIPPLGIVVIASQIGRCAICVLTRSKNGTFGLRTDWTLPTRKQESHKIRPLKPLLGIAVPPLQGQTRSEYSESSSDGESHRAWGTDGVVDGVGTSFDPTIVVLRDDASHVESSPMGAGQGTKQKRLSYDQREPASSGQHREIREWSLPPQSNPWNAAENSTRYRLMLTYSDFTVITYELSRGVERGDIAQCHVSTMDLVD